MTEDTLFELVLNTPISQRADLIERICANRPELREKVGKLLAIVEAFNLQSAAISTNQISVATPAQDFQETSELSTPVGDSVDSQLGPFRLLQLLGEGGMGTVWVAEQIHPVKRRVALKLIRSGLGSRRILARFDAERQALAMMEHTSIAKVLDAGTTPDGRPYIAMELVKGVPITKYCNEVHASIETRLEIFTEVCAAIQHAHTKGIIHRDLKPSNILVTIQDGKPVPKVIDFGIAKALNQKLTDQSMYTEIGQVIGTLEYMAPEQAELSALDIDTRADVYALGVVLFELLAGSTPITRDRMKSAAFSEILRVIKEEEPPKPSTRLANSNESLSQLATQRRTNPKRLRSQLRGELDWIVLKALEKDRTRRYETANAFRRDIERYLRDDPIEARPASNIYRFQKFYRRHRWLVVSACVLAISLTGGFFGTTWGLFRAREAESKAHANYLVAEQLRKRAAEREEEAIRLRDQANLERHNAETVRDFLRNNLLKLANPWERANTQLSRAASRPVGTSFTVEELLNRAAQEFSPATINERFPNQPVIQIEILETIGNSLESLQQFEQSIEYAKKSQSIKQEYFGSYHPRTLTGHITLGFAYLEAGRIPDSVSELLKALTKLELYLSKNAKEGALQSTEVPSMLREPAVELADLVLDQVVQAVEQRLDPKRFPLNGPEIGIGEGGLAAIQILTAIPRIESLHRLVNSKFGERDHRTAIIYFARAITYHATGRIKEALAIYESIDQYATELLSPKSFIPIALKAQILITKRMLKEPNDVLMVKFQALIASIEGTLGKDHPFTLAFSKHVALIYVNERKFKEANDILSAIVDRAHRFMEPQHPFVVNTRLTMADCLLQLRRYPEALAILKEIVEGNNTSQQIPSMVFNLGYAYQMMGDYKRAITQYEKVLSLTKKDVDLIRVNALGEMALCLRNIGQTEQTVELDREALRISERHYGPNSRQTLLWHFFLGQTYYRLARFPEAFLEFDITVRGREKLLGELHDETIYAMNWRGACKYHQDLWLESLPDFERAARIIESKSFGHYFRENILWSLISTYRKLGRRADEELWLRKFLEVEKSRPDGLTATALRLHLAMCLVRQQKNWEEAESLLGAVQKVHHSWRNKHPPACQPWFLDVDEFLYSAIEFGRSNGELGFDRLELARSKLNVAIDLLKTHPADVNAITMEYLEIAIDIGQTIESQLKKHHDSVRATRWHELTAPWRKLSEQKLRESRMPSKSHVQ